MPGRIGYFNLIIIIIIIIIIAVISIEPYLTDMGEHNTLYKINKNVHIKTSRTLIVSRVLL